MKKAFVIAATAAMGFGIAAPLVGSNHSGAQKVQAASTKYSYVSNTSSSVSVTNISKGSSVAVLNSNKKTVSTMKASKNGTVTFKLSSSQLKNITAKDQLKVTLKSGYSYVINFNFVGYKAPVSAVKLSNGVPKEIQGTWTSSFKLGKTHFKWVLSSNKSQMQGNDPQILSNVKYQSLGNHKYVLQGIEKMYSGGSTEKINVQLLSSHKLQVAQGKQTMFWTK